MRCTRAILPAWAGLVVTVLLPGHPAPATTVDRPQPAPPARGKSTLVEKALQAMDGAQEIVFAVRSVYKDGHYYATCGHWSADPNRMIYAEGGAKLCKINLRTRKVTVLVDDPQGGVRDPRVAYDGKKLLFAYRKGGTKYFHLYEIRPDGTNLRQLTSGDFDDVEPEYLPDGGIVFISTRGNRFVPCYHTQVGLLHRMDADGTNVRLLSANNVGDHCPTILPDGRVLYTRWEYVDRAPQKFHSLWAMNPDGTEQMVLFGNTVAPDGRHVVMIDSMPIPGSDKVVAVFSPGHGNRESAGDIMVVDPRGGPDDWSRVRQISPPRVTDGNWQGGGGGSGRVGFRDPYALSEDCYLVVENQSLFVMDGHGTLEEVYRADDVIHEPRVIRARPRQRLIPARSDPRKATGQLVLANAYQGRNMEGVRPGEIKQLLVLEDLPKPVSFFSLFGAISMDGTHTLHRILGTVPVEPDGSAAFEVPALRGLYFVALDEHGLAVKRMQSYVTVMPGETLSCVGCHENRAQTPPRTAALMALNRRPSRIEPIPDVPEVLDYPRDIQPILDKHCVTCHNSHEPQGRVVLSGDYNEWFSQSYYSLFAHKQISDSWRYDENGNHPPRGFGTAASPLMKKLDGGHYNVRLSDLEHKRIQLWIESGATYAGTYAAYNDKDVAVSGALFNNPKVVIDKPLGPIVERRCLTCHESFDNLGRRHVKGRVNLPKHCWNLYNLSHPEKSMMLLAPLAKAAGGYEWCQPKDSHTAPVFQDTEDTDYQTILAAIRAAQQRQQQAGRFDMPGFRPNEHYVRWMKRFGILPDGFDPVRDPLDPYQTDQAYWRSFWYQPAGGN